ncbi:hypothetical protein D3C78_1953350 [compost metagenome]
MQEAAGAEELARHLRSLLAGSKVRRQMGEAGMRVLCRNQGALERLLEGLTHRLLRSRGDERNP